MKKTLLFGLVILLAVSAPRLFAGHDIPSQRIARPVTPYDIAATIATCLEIKPPSGSVGIPLIKVLRGE